MRSRSSLILVCAALSLAALPHPAPAGTLYTAMNGIDPPGCTGCGDKSTPCRSIGCAMTNAVSGDKIVVGPGRYGDLDRNGTLGNTSGEENPGAYAPGCGCMVALNKTVSLTSSDGAAATVIDATNVNVPTNVLLITTGGTFGKPGKGFTVTNTASLNPAGIGIDSDGVSVEGNQVLGHSIGSTSSSPGTGIYMVNSAGTARIAGNQIHGWDTGIRTDGTGKTVQKNLVTHNVVGIAASSGLADIVGNVLSANYNAGVGLFVAGNVIGNAFLGNTDGILITSGAFSGTIEKNNFAGNVGCGIRFFGGASSTLTVPDNYWGAATGPGPDPADQPCSGGTITTAPFAPTPFKVKARVKP